MKLKRTTERIPTNPLTQEGMEQYTRLQCHVTIYQGGGNWGWRGLVQQGEDTLFGPADRYLVEGQTAQELGDAMHALMVSIQQGPLEEHTALPEPKKQLEGGE